jgi:hypothetical protein
MNDRSPQSNYGGLCHMVMGSYEGGRTWVQSQDLSAGLSRQATKKTTKILGSRENSNCETTQNLF